MAFEEQPMPAPVVRPNRRIKESQMAVAEYARQDLIVTPEQGTTIEEMQAPEYWVHIARRLRPMDRIEVRPADGMWWAELLVRVVETMAVRVHVLRLEVFGRTEGMTEIDIPDGYSVEHRGLEQWCVKRHSDQEIIHRREPSRLHAIAWLHGHLGRLGTPSAATPQKTPAKAA